jgi:hypothetical protein
MISKRFRKCCPILLLSLFWGPFWRLLFCGSFCSRSLRFFSLPFLSGSPQLAIYSTTCFHFGPGGESAFSKIHASKQAVGNSFLRQIFKHTFAFLCLFIIFSPWPLPSQLPPTFLDFEYLCLGGVLDVRDLNKLAVGFWLCHFGLLACSCLPFVCFPFVFCFAFL